MIHIEQAAPGLHVWYKPNPNGMPEYGAITNSNDRFVFVRFCFDNHAKACRPEDLHWPPHYVALDGTCPEGQHYSP